MANDAASPDTRELEFAGRPFRVTGNLAPLHRFRGFFAGDDLAPHAHTEGEGEHHRADITVQFDGQLFDLHRTTDGDVHSHDMPTMSFASIDAAAETIAKLVDLGILHGRPAEPG